MRLISTGFILRQLYKRPVLPFVFCNNWAIPAEAFGLVVALVFRFAHLRNEGPRRGSRQIQPVLWNLHSRVWRGLIYTLFHNYYCVAITISQFVTISQFQSLALCLLFLGNAEDLSMNVSPSGPLPIASDKEMRALDDRFSKKISQQQARALRRKQYLDVCREAANKGVI